jgi:4-diphosphocytidyl-2-C-methyl-D-erythritol kinase
VTITLLANAKINPTLRVLGRREDGFHELVTTMLALELGDVVSVSLSDGDGVEATVRGELASPDIPTDGSNLAVRGALLGRDAAGSAEGLSVQVIKNIPSRAGLGGGSSDAAAAARAAVVELGEEDACLGGRLAALGSDCAFFQAARRTGAALALGRGEEITPLEGPRGWWIALLTPEVECSTPAVYGALAAGPAAPTPGWRLRADSAARELFGLSALEARGALANDLEPAASAAVPGLQPWFALLEAESAAHFRLAGSGSSFFGLFDDEPSAREALRRIEAGAAAQGLGIRLSLVTRPAGSALTTVPGVDLG